MYLLLFTLFFAPLLDEFLKTEGKINVKVFVDKKIVLLATATLMSSGFFCLRKLGKKRRETKEKSNREQLLRKCKNSMKSIVYDGPLRLAKDYNSDNNEARKKTQIWNLQKHADPNIRQQFLIKIKKLNKSLLEVYRVCFEENTKIDHQLVKKMDKLITSKVELCSATWYRFCVYNIIGRVYNGIWENYLNGTNPELVKQFIKETREAISKTQDVTIKICDQCIKFDEKEKRKERFMDVKELLQETKNNFDKIFSEAFAEK